VTHTLMSIRRVVSNHNGWTPARRSRFLRLLARNGNVRAAAVACGLSRQSVYKLRRSDPLFAREWDGALAQRRAAADREVEALLDAWRERKSGLWTPSTLSTRCQPDGLEEPGHAGFARFSRPAQAAQRSAGVGRIGVST